MALIIDNDDCLTHILEYLPSNEVWSIIHASPAIFRNHQLYRCAWEALRKCAAPFTLVNRNAGWTIGTITLEDRYQQCVTNVEHSEFLHSNGHLSNIRELVKAVEIECSFSTTGHMGSSQIDRGWIDLISPLPCLESLTLSHLDSYSDRGNAIPLARLPVDFAPVLPNLTSFAVRLGEAYIRSAERDGILQMLGQMAKVKALEIPTYFLASVAQRLPALAHGLRELTIYQNDRRSVACQEIIRMIGSGPFLELRQLHYRQDFLLRGEAACQIDVATLAALAQLQVFSVDCWKIAPASDVATQLVSLPHLHVRVIVSSSNSDTLHFLVARCSGLRQISFYVDKSYWRKAGQSHYGMLQLLSSDNVAPSLRELRITYGGPGRESRHGCSFLIGCLKSCRQLELVDMSYPVVNLTGFANHAQGGPGRFEPCKDLRAIVNELASMPSIKNVRFTAKIDSIYAVRRALPGNSKIIDFQMKPREARAYPRSVALLLGEERFPTRLLIRGQKNALIPKQDANYSDKFYIYVVVL